MNVLMFTKYSYIVTNSIKNANININYYLFDRDWNGNQQFNYSNFEFKVLFDTIMYSEYINLDIFITFSTL